MEGLPRKVLGEKRGVCQGATFVHLERRRATTLHLNLAISLPLSCHSLLSLLVFAYHLVPYYPLPIRASEVQLLPFAQ